MNSLVTFFTIMFTIIDDTFKAIYGASSLKRPCGVAPSLTDTEVITLSLALELLDKPQEYLFLKDMLRFLPTLFPKLLSQSRFNRRRRSLLVPVNTLRHTMMQQLLPLCSQFGLLDTIPVKVVGYRRSKKRSHFRGIAAYGYCAAKDEKYFGFKLVLLVSPEGLPINFAIVPANISDTKTPWEVLDPIYNFTVLADKGMLGKKQQQDLKVYRNITLQTPRRKNQKGYDHAANACLSSIRQMVETVGSQLNATVNLNRHYAKTMAGFLTRMASKLTAFSVGFMINVRYGCNPLSIRSLSYELA